MVAWLFLFLGMLHLLLIIINFFFISITGMLLLYECLMHSLCVSFSFLVHKTNDFWAFWSGFTDGGSRPGSSDRVIERHKKEIWKCAAAGQSTDQSLLQHGADAARTRWHLCWPQSEISRVTGEISKCVQFYTPLKKRPMTSICSYVNLLLSRP